MSTGYSPDQPVISQREMGKKQMKIKALTLTAIATPIAAIGLVMTASTAPSKITQQEIAALEAKEKHGLTLRDKAKLAKLRGQHKLFIPRSHGTTLYVGFSDMETAAANYTAVLRK
jgi:hypothetical protein